MRLPLLAAVTLLAGSAVASPLPTPPQIARDAHAHGARRTVDALSDDQWTRLTDRIAQGGGEWIALAPRLAPGTDAARAEELGIALAFALTRNPKAVLAAIDPHDGVVLGVHRVCGRPFIEDSEPVHYQALGVQAVSRVRDHGLARSRQACLGALRTNMDKPLRRG